MMDFGDSELRRRLVSEGLRNGSAGTETTRGIGDGGTAGKSDPRHQPAGEGGERQPMGMRQGTIRKTRVPFLMLIIGGKR